VWRAKNGSASSTRSLAGKLRALRRLRREQEPLLPFVFTSAVGLARLPEGELCLLGQGTTRTSEAGGGADVNVADGMIPEVTASGRDIVLVPPGNKDEIGRPQRDRAAAVLRRR
jgi:hypothetical protein